MSSQKFCSAGLEVSSAHDDKFLQIVSSDQFRRIQIVSMDLRNEREHYHTHLRDMLTAPKQELRIPVRPVSEGFGKRGRFSDPSNTKIEGFGHVHLTAIKKQACQ
jgi:hypothetical protein